MTNFKTPSVLWGQRTSITTRQKNFIYLTVDLRGIIHSTLKYTLTDTTISLKVNAKGGDEECEYAFELDFYAEVIPKALKRERTPQSVTIVIFKKNITAQDWPQLSKIVLSYVKTGLTPPAIPEVSWSQRSSPTDRRKSIIFLSVNAQDIAESTLKCTVTDTSISFYAYAREDYEERAYAFDLDFYADVIPEVVEKNLTDQCLTITLLKKQMDGQNWPRLQKAAELLPYVRTDLKRWAEWEHDHSDAIIRASGSNGGQDFSQAGELSDLGVFFCKRFNRLEDMRDLENAISSLEDALRLTPYQGHRYRFPIICNKLGNSYLCRFEHTGNLQDSECAIFHHQRAVETAPSGHADLPLWLNNLGNSYLSRFECTGNLPEIDRAISHLRSAVESTPSGHVDLPSRFSSLGNSYFCRFQRTGNLLDLEHAISHQQNAVETTSSGHPSLPMYLSNLGNSYSCRFECTGNLQDVDRGISHNQSAVESTPADHPNLPGIFSNLGNSYLCRFERTGNLLDIERAIVHHQSAVKSSPSSHASRPMYLSNLGNSYFRHFERTGNPQDIEHAIFHYHSSVGCTPSGHSDLPSRFSNLGNSYLRRFEHTGDLQDIENAISHHQSALESTPSGHAGLPMMFNNLGSSYLRHFERTGSLQDIERAISHFQSAVESTPSNHASLPRRFSNLGISCFHRFQCTGDLQDIKRAISYHQSAVNTTPSGHQDLPGFFNNLGSSYLHLFRHTGELQDIECSISHHRSALASTPSGHADLPSRFNNLGYSYLCCFERTGNLQDIDHSISYHQSAVKSSPSGHAGLPIWFKNLGNSYHLRFQSIHHLPDVQNSITSYRKAAEANGSPFSRLESARLAAMLSSAHDESDQCLTDFALAISLLSEVAGLEQTIHRRHANLQGRSSFVGSAVVAALRFGEADLALEWLEQGRCLVWNQLDQLRTPIDDLRVKSSSLADRFIKVASALESHGTRSSSIPLPYSTLTEDIRLQGETRDRTILAAEYSQLLEKIWALPDFHDFLRPLKATKLLSSIPTDGPVVIFNVNEARCDCLALIAGMEEPLHIPLEKFSFDQAKKLRDDLQSDLLMQRKVEDGDRATFRLSLNPSFSISLILENLWHNVVQPVLEALGYSPESPPEPSDRRRIWWCPTGPVAFLPLHAAGIYGSAYKPGSCVSDFVVSSYTPTVRSLNEKFSASSVSLKCTNIMLISQPNSPGLSPIPSARRETHALKPLLEGTPIDSLLLEGCEAAQDRVKAEMKAYSWVHFACHGIQDVSDPLKSGVHLHDGRLELLEIMKQQIPNPDLAFLSACQTSKGDIELSEEVVHLAAGMLAAGYRGVVGTMWNISDMHGPEFATEFYQYLVREKGSEGLDSTRAAYALDRAVRKVRESLGKDDAAFLTWVPYVHFGY